MNYKQFTTIVFSPTERTKAAARLIARQVDGNQAELDLTDALRRPDYHFDENEAVLVGVPVYGGRVPETAAERLLHLHGNHTPAILLVTYGNRAYEDALAELRDILKKQGFHPIAAAAVVTEHNIVHKIAAGRPDRKDQEAVQAFGRRVNTLLADMRSTYHQPEPDLPGNVPYRPYHTIPFRIRVGSSCRSCGLCIRKCPVQAISRTDPRVTDTQRCISCMRCVHVCPTKERKVSTLMLLAAGHKLKKVCAARREPEFWPGNHETGK